MCANVVKVHKNNGTLDLYNLNQEGHISASQGTYWNNSGIIKEQVKSLCCLFFILNLQSMVQINGYQRFDNHSTCHTVVSW